MIKDMGSKSLRLRNTVNLYLQPEQVYFWDETELSSTEGRPIIHIYITFFSIDKKEFTYKENSKGL